MKIKKFIFTLAVIMTCSQVGKYVEKCEMPDGNTCYIFSRAYKGGISCIKN